MYGVLHSDAEVQRSPRNDEGPRSPFAHHEALDDCGLQHERIQGSCKQIRLVGYSATKNPPTMLEPFGTDLSALLIRVELGSNGNRPHIVRCVKEDDSDRDVLLVCDAHPVRALTTIQ